MFFTISTSLVLTVVFIAILLIMEQQMEMSNRDNFRTILQTITNKLQTSNQISHLWVAEQESKNHLLLSIYDNKVEIQFLSMLPSKTERSLLFQQLKQRSLEENIDIHTRPVSSTLLSSPIFTIQGEKKDHYYGAAVVFPVAKGFRSFYLLQDLSAHQKSIQDQRILFFLFYLTSMLSFYFISRKMVMLSLAPVKESHQKQVEFIAAASHELRSPLTVIRANNSAISYQETMEEVIPFSSGIESECTRMARLIDDMLLLASADTSHWSIKKESIDMDCLFIDLYECFLPLCKEKFLSLELDLPDETLPAFWGDQQRIRQILSALLDNAISYAPEHTKLLLKAYPYQGKKPMLCLEVIDHGHGIPDSQKPYLFERFYRMDKSRKDKQHFGLGLSITKELVQLHNGTITILDTKGGGATFHITLPLT